MVSLQRLITSYESGRKIELQNILKYELMSVPLSLANRDGSVRSGSKPALCDILTNGMACSKEVPKHEGRACLIIDGMAKAVALGKPVGAQTFGVYADHFTASVLHNGKEFDRIDVIFDRYTECSIKETMRKRRSKTMQPVRRIIEGRDVPLPANWPNFLALPENKSDRTRFLSDEMIRRAPTDKEAVTARGYTDPTKVGTSSQFISTSVLNGMHEEADTRIILHCNLTNFCDTIAVLSARYRCCCCSFITDQASTADICTSLSVQRKSVKYGT